MITFNDDNHHNKNLTKGNSQVSSQALVATEKKKRPNEAHSEARALLCTCVNFHRDVAPAVVTHRHTRDPRSGRYSHRTMSPVGSHES